MAMTLAEARAAVAAKLAILDIEAQPELVNVINDAIASSQRTLAITNRWILPIRSSTLAVVATRTIYPIPGDRYGMRRVQFQSSASLGSQPYPLTGGRLGEARSDATGDPSRCDIRPVQGIASVTITLGGTGFVNGAVATFGAPGGTGTTAQGYATVAAGAITAIVITDPGSGYATAPTLTVAGGSGATLVPVVGEVMALQIEPTPSSTGSLLLDWQDVPARKLNEGTTLVVDEEAVILTAAIQAAPACKSTQQEALVGLAKAYLDELRSASRPSAGGFNLSPMRRGQ